MNLALLLARGVGALADTLLVRRKARVLYCQGEIDEWESSRRWRMLLGGEPPPGEVGETFERWRLRPVRHRSTERDRDGSDSTEWTDVDLNPALEEAIVKHRIDVLIIDPWAVYYAGNENSNDETEAALDKLRDLALEHGVAIVILHHPGKATEAREPEDLWRGASRLGDWASTRVTIWPHYTDSKAKKQGMTRQQARRYVDVHFLRRSTPTPDFGMHLDPDTGWWKSWRPPESAAAERKIQIGTAEVVAALEDAGGSWSSTTKAAKDLHCAVNTASKLLAVAEAEGVIERVRGGQAIGWQLTTHDKSVPDLWDEPG
jgi:hypothetical protein